MKGVILTAGTGSRLRPITNAYGKSMVPIYDKPMIFYGLSMMIECGIKDIAIVANDFDLPFYHNLLDRYLDYGLNIQYFVQYKATGTANAVSMASDFVGEDSFVLLFGDNIFVQKDFSLRVKDAIKNNRGITLFAKSVPDPERFGVIEQDDFGNILSVEEKPICPKSNLASTGLYVCAPCAMKMAKNVKKSPRGEYEFTDVIIELVNKKLANVSVSQEDCVWLDTGTFDSLLQCSQVIKDFEDKFGIYGSIEMAMLKSNMIDNAQFKDLISIYKQDYINKFKIKQPDLSI